MESAAVANPVRQISIFVTSASLSLQSKSTEEMRCTKRSLRKSDGGDATADSIIGGKIPNLPLVFLPADKLAGLGILGCIRLVEGGGTDAKTVVKWI